MIKKTKIIFLGLIFIISLSAIFFVYEERKRTYLKCGSKFYAIDKYFVYYKWDDVEQKFFKKLKINHQDKTNIIVTFTYIGDSKLNKGEYRFNRIKGNVSLYHNGVLQVTKDCVKAYKKDLPIKKIKQKF